MPLDIEALRNDTPGCRNRLHFNNAGAAMQPAPVLAAVRNHLDLEAEIGGYEAAAQANDKLENFYDAAAALIGGKRHEVAFIENATRAWDMAFYAFDWQPGDRILTAEAEYASNYIAYLQVAKKYGVNVAVVPNDERGQTSADALADMIDPSVKLISMTHVPTNGGLVNPAAEIGKIAKAHGIPFLLDACQSVGQMPIDVNEVGCDMLSATGRKYLRGPRGTGLLWVRDKWIERLEPPLLDLHAAEWVAEDRFEVRSDARRFENWECFFAGKIGLGVAMDYARGLGMDNIYARIQQLAAVLRDALADTPGITVTDLGASPCGIVTFAVAGHDHGTVKQRLSERQINVSVSGLSSTRLDMAARNLNDVIRASVHYYNTEEEIDEFCEALRDITA